MEVSLETSCKNKLSIVKTCEIGEEYSCKHCNGFKELEINYVKVISVKFLQKLAKILESYSHHVKINKKTLKNRRLTLK